MKTKILITSIMSLLMVVTPAFAVTTVDSAWNGAGLFGMTFTSGDDAHSTFSISGSEISGQYHAIDSGDNPYGYNVDTTDLTIKSHVTNGGILYSFVRDGSYSPMYGVAGQESYTLIDTLGTGDFAWHSTSNYASLSNSNYGWQNNNQIMATGEHYISHYISAGSNNGAGIQVDADGTTQISDMCDGASGDSSFSFGKGCGCYTNANVNIVGSGEFDLTAIAENHIVTDTGITVDGGSYNVHSLFSNGFHFSNYALTGS